MRCLIETILVALAVIIAGPVCSQHRANKWQGAIQRNGGAAVHQVDAASRCFIDDGVIGGHVIDIVAHPASQHVIGTQFAMQSIVANFAIQVIQAVGKQGVGIVTPIQQVGVYRIHTAKDALIYSPTAGPKPPDLRTSAH